MSKKLSLSLIIAGAALLLFACGLFIYNKVYDYRAGVRAQELLDQMMAGYDWDLPPVSEMTYTPLPASAEPANESVGEPAGGRASRDGADSGDTLPVIAKPIVVFDSSDEEASEGDDSSGSGGSSGGSGGWTAPSYSVIGIISLPRLGVRLPVIGECTNYLLGISCCRLSGLADEKPIRLVIAGHNISSHFKGLDTYEIGDEIAYTTTGGETYYYRATEISAVQGADGGPDVLAADGWDITLLTCKSERTMRTMVRFVEITE